MMNSSDDQTGDLYNKTVHFIEVYVETIILSFGFVFNILNLITLHRSKVASSCRLFLQAISISDLGMCISGVCYLLINNVYYRKDGWEYGYWYDGTAVVNFTVLSVFIYFQIVSSLIALTLGFIRGRTIANPLKFINTFPPRRIKLICFLILFITFFLHFPSLIFILWQVCYNDVEKVEFCYQLMKKLPSIEYTKYGIYIEAFFAGPVILALYIVCLLIIKIQLRKSDKLNEALNKNQRDERKKRNRKVLKTLTLILIIDTICLLPGTVDYMAIGIAPNNQVFNRAGTVAGVVTGAISGILIAIRPSYNIFVYLFTNNDFKEAFLELFFCFAKKR